MIIIELRDSSFRVVIRIVVTGPVIALWFDVRTYANSGTVMTYRFILDTHYDTIILYYDVILWQKNARTINLYDFIITQRTIVHLWHLYHYNFFNGLNICITAILRLVF